jgi:RNA polymerase sigma factor (sigma-70 family)
MDMYDNEKDAMLWNQFRLGDGGAFSAVFKKYYTGLYNYGCRITDDTNLVEDCIQELFIDIWRTSGKAEVQSVKAYLFTAFKFKLMKLLAKNSKTSLLAADNQQTFVLGQDVLLINKETDAQKNKQVLDAISQLSPRQKEIIYLKFYLNLSYEEVSELMQINYQAARNLIYKAIKELKNKIAPAIVAILIQLLF